MSRRTKVLIATSISMIVVVAFAGVAYGSDGSVPGDALYGLDRALENVGVGAGGLQERMSESGGLIEEGKVDEGLAHAAEALAEEQEDLDGDDDGELTDEEQLGRQEALLAAAEAVLANGSEQSLEVRTRVAEKLRWMATTELTGKEFGQAVSALAKDLSPDGEQDGTGEGKGQGADKDKTNNGKALGHSK